jgi:hypothetical protein
VIFTLNKIFSLSKVGQANLHKMKLSYAIILSVINLAAGSVLIERQYVDARGLCYDVSAISNQLILLGLPAPMYTIT